MAIIFAGEIIIKLYNVAFPLQYNSNLILLSQLYKNSIIYHNYLNIIILMKD